MSFWGKLKETVQNTLAETRAELTSTISDLSSSLGQEQRSELQLSTVLQKLFADDSSLVQHCSTELPEWQYKACATVIPSYMNFIPDNAQTQDQNPLLSEVQWQCAEDLLRLLPNLATRRAKCVPSALYPRDEPFFATYFDTVQKCLQTQDESQWAEHNVNVWETRREKHKLEAKNNRANTEQRALDTNHLNELLLNIKDDALRLSNQLNMLAQHRSEQSIAELALKCKNNKEQLAQIIGEIQNRAQDHPMLNSCLSLNKELATILRKFAEQKNVGAGGDIELEEQSAVSAESEQAEERNPEDDDGGERVMPWDNDDDGNK